MPDQSGLGSLAWLADGEKSRGVFVRENLGRTRLWRLHTKPFDEHGFYPFYPVSTEDSRCFLM